MEKRRKGRRWFKWEIGESRSLTYKGTKDMKRRINDGRFRTWSGTSGSNLLLLSKEYGHLVPLDSNSRSLSFIFLGGLDEDFRHARHYVSRYIQFLSTFISSLNPHQNNFSLWVHFLALILIAWPPFLLQLRVSINSLPHRSRSKHQYIGVRALVLIFSPSNSFWTFQHDW